MPAKKTLEAKSEKDSDLHKGAVETDRPEEASQSSLSQQQQHRDSAPEAEGADSDFPEPGESPEHSGQHS